MNEAKRPNLNERIASLEEVTKIIDKELTDFTGWRATIPNREEIAEIVQAQFKGQNERLLAQLSSHDVSMKKYIDDTIVEAVKAGIQAYDKTAREIYLTKSDSESPAYVGSDGKPLLITRGAPQMGGQGQGFFDVIGNLVFKAIQGAEGSGNMPSWAASSWDAYQKMYDRRMQLEWQSFLKRSFSQIPVLPSTEGGGHVELQG